LNNSISISKEKIEVIQLQKRLTTQKDAQFLKGFTNFYQQFIENFSKDVKLLSDLIKDKFKGKCFVWSEYYAEFVKRLKDLFICILII
jgi:hypothetical protein